MALELVCIGHIVREMIHFPNSVKGPFLGGPPAYCSVAAACQGIATGLVSKIGPELPHTLLQPLYESGVDISGMRNCGITTTTELVYDNRGNKEILYPSKSQPIRAADVPVSFRGCNIIYVCAMDNDVVEGDLEAVARLGQISAVDLGGYGGVHMNKANRMKAPSLTDLACSTAAHFAIAKASDEDAVSIFGQDDPETAAEKLLASGLQLVIITQGPKGVLVSTKKKRWHVQPLSTRVVDTTGGGDTFMAGFLSKYLRSGDPLASAQWGCATASYVIEKTGGVRVDRMPTFDQVKKRVLEGYHLRNI